MLGTGEGSAISAPRTLGIGEDAIISASDTLGIGEDSVSAPASLEGSEGCHFSSWYPLD